ncbi:hypothetical protein, conserved [Trypanosoma brucei brucei TREU927]|uniref:Uncharacterized protein n=1 Tax=Trypanosoma brucei brucei (strain 927/4 GUTat10.1) TaxID=185431 RepID=Q38EH0_TRYB2|nr:hypothetical protein, conserved [Trypanosoma brucei brucei TREU927]EAN76800.1 hypothetical protein, conserved [Trypanosoma brucei brucei TREU927]
MLFGVLLLMSRLSEWASADSCDYTKWMEEDYTDHMIRLSLTVRGSYSHEKNWVFCDLIDYSNVPKLWKCSNEKTLDELVQKHKLLQDEVEGRGLCNKPVITKTKPYEQQVKNLKAELQRWKEKIQAKKIIIKKAEEVICSENSKKATYSTETVATLQTSNKEKIKKIDKSKQQCNDSITQHIINSTTEILRMKNASLYNLKRHLNSMTQMFEEGMKKRSCTVCSAETCYSTPSVKAELDKMYLENSWLNLTAAQREQCLLDDTMLLPMLSYMRRKPFDGAYAYNRNVDMVEKLFALVISFFSFFL